MASKVINDCIHGLITIPPAAVLLIDTLQFQRLHEIKQLGTVYKVYPGAKHSRFEHSLGVAHLAERIGKRIQAQQPELVTDKDVLCVMIAGLGHDLGHGPCSHLWEQFMKEYHPDSEIPFCHEKLSIEMFERLLEENNLKKKLLEVANIGDQDILFIEELIAGAPLKPNSSVPMKKEDWIGDDKPWLFRGRGESKSFLYDIVANKINGVDVDKWDYFLRDSYHLNIKQAFNPDLYIEHVKIVSVGKRKRLCVSDAKGPSLLMDLQRDRDRLHEEAYQHRVCLILDRMLMDAWGAAAESFMVKGSNGKEIALGKVSLEDLTAHETLDDSLSAKILDSDLPGLEEAKTALRRYMKRDLYAFVDEVNIINFPKVNELATWKLINHFRDFIGRSETSLDKSDVTLVRKRVTSGIKYDKVAFCDKQGDAVECDPNRLYKGCNINTVYICLKEYNEVHHNQLKELVAQWKEEIAGDPAQKS